MNSTLFKLIDWFNIKVYAEKVIQIPSGIEVPGVGRRWLAKLFYRLGYKKGAEIGVEKGLYSEILCKENPNLELYCIDAWELYSDYHDWLNKPELLDGYNETVRRLQPYNTKIIKSFSAEAAQQFENNSLDFCYIDANHEFPWVVDDIFHWSKKIKPGGIIAGHDFYRASGLHSNCHVLSAVAGYTHAYRIWPWFVLGSENKKKGEFRDGSRSWFWIKEED
jgi:hypothetical protein